MTTPIVVRTGGAGEALASIGQTIGQLADPDREKREQFERFLISDPGNVAALAEQIRLNPALAETIFDFVPEETLAAIRATPRTSIQEIEGATADFLAGAPPDVQDIFGRFTAAAMANTNPKEIATLGQELAARLAAIKEPGVARAGAIRDITGLTPGQLSGDAIDAELNTRALGLFQGFEGPSQDRTALRNSLEAALVDSDLALQHVRRRELALIGIDAGSQAISDRAEEARQQAEAIDMVAQTNIGTSAGWQVYLFNLGFNRRGRTLLQQVRSGGEDPSNLSVEPAIDPQTGEVLGPSDRDLFEMANAQANRLVNDKIGDLLSQNSLIDAQITDIERERPGGGKLMSRSGRQFAVSRLNSLMLQLHNQYPNEIPLFTSFITRNGPLRWLDEAGVELETGNPFAMPNFFQRTIEGIMNFIGGGQRPPIPEDVPEPAAPGPSVQRAPLEERQIPGSPGAQSPAEQARAATEQAQAVTRVSPDLSGLPPIDTTNVNIAELSPEGRNNVIVIQEGRGTFKQLMELSPREAILILENIRIQTPRVQQLIDSLTARLPEEDSQ